MSELDQYDYELPTERIAQWPLPVRSDARLMLVNRKDQSIEHFHVRDLPELLRAGDALTSSVGAYQLEGLGVQLFEEIEGDYFTILGLPLLPLLRCLRAQGALPS